MVCVGVCLINFPIVSRDVTYWDYNESHTMYVFRLLGATIILIHAHTPIFTVRD